MEGLSIFHYLILMAIVIVGFAIPAAKILSRLGYTGLWALLIFVPLGAMIGLWILASADWPVLARKSG